MPGRLNAMLIGEMYAGILIAPCGPQAVTDRAISSSLRNASDPANWVAPASSAARQTPEPTEAYCTWNRGCIEANPLNHAFMAEVCGEEQATVRDPVNV